VADNILDPYLLKLQLSLRTSKMASTMTQIASFSGVALKTQAPR
jgi:hypothetical protein